MKTLQESMTGPPDPAPVVPPDAAKQALASLLAAVQGLQSGAEDAQGQLSKASASAQTVLQPPDVTMGSAGAGAPEPRNHAADHANAAAARDALAEKRAAELLAEIDSEPEPGNKKARLQEALRQAYGVEPFLSTQVQ